MDFDITVYTIYMCVRKTDEYVFDINLQPEQWSFWRNLFHRFLCSCEEFALLPFLSLSLWLFLRQKVSEENK